MHWPLIIKFVGMLTCPVHALGPNMRKTFHYFSLQWRQDHEESVASESAWPKVDEQQDETYSHLNWCGPGHMEPRAAEINARNISRDVIDKFAICQRQTCARRQTK